MCAPAVPPAAYAELVLAVRHLPTTRTFFEKLGYTRLPANDDPKTARLTDGRINLFLRQGAFSSPRIHYHLVHTEAVEQTLRDPTGLAVLLLTTPAPAPQPAAADPILPGRFGELAIPTRNLTISLDFWLNRGLAVASRGTDPYPWALLDDGNLPVGLHQTTSFGHPALTYFSADAPARIRALKAAGFTFTEEFEDQGEISHAALVTPDDVPIFVFQS